jgi:hypothetical protein
MSLIVGAGKVNAWLAVTILDEPEAAGLPPFREGIEFPDPALRWPGDESSPGQLRSL